MWETSRSPAMSAYQWRSPSLQNGANGLGNSNGRATGRAIALKQIRRRGSVLCCAVHPRTAVSSRATVGVVDGSARHGTIAAGGEEFWIRGYQCGDLSAGGDSVVGGCRPVVPRLAAALAQRPPRSCPCS